MPGEHRNPHARARDAQARQFEDLAALVAELLLLVGLVVAVVDEVAGERDHVEGDRGDVLLRLGEVDRRPVVDEVERVALREHALDLAEELLGSREAGARHGLVGADDEALEARGLVQGLQHGHRGHRGAVRVRDDALGRVDGRVRVDLADDEGHLGVHPPGARVVDDDGAGLGEARGVRARSGRTGREQGDVDAGRVGGRDVLDDDRLAAVLDRRAGRAGRGEQAQLADRERALRENLAHDGADLAGGADDGDGES